MYWDEDESLENSQENIEHESQEKHLWQNICKGVTPLKQYRKYIVPEQVSTPRKIALPYLNPADAEQRIKMPLAAMGKQDKPLFTNSSHKVDSRTAKHVITGKYPPQATLDLHGMNQDQAFESLISFIAYAYERQKRCVLVITGKGGMGQQRGTLFQQTPNWLNHPRLKPMVLMFSHAKPHHGGEGALYILLKRLR
jgi:DNA-nicking Smr family endonuclease